MNASRASMMPGVLRATQAGDANHDPAPAVEHTVNIVAELGLFADGFE